MKRILTMLSLIVGLSASATHSLTYYIYYETEYIQGPWSRIDLLEESEYKYLDSQSFEDLFGSENTDLVNKMLSRLKDKKPEIYDWPYQITFQHDTVILALEEDIESLETIKNEITATLIFNNFKAVVFRINDKQETWTIKNLTLPYLDLVSGNQKASKQIEKQIQSNKTTTKEPKNKEENPLTTWLIISCLINVVVIILWVLRSRF